MTEKDKTRKAHPPEAMAFDPENPWPEQRQELTPEDPHRDGAPPSGKK